MEKENTDSDYNQALTLCIENIDIVSVCAGTHNEESSALLVDLLKKHNISKDDKRVYFSQLLGMSDHISYNAAKKGFNVVKYVPYGPVKEVLPYLIRRAKENTSIAGQMSRELSEQEIVRRESLQKLRDLGINPYPADTFDVNNTSENIKNMFPISIPKNP